MVDLMNRFPDTFQTVTDRDLFGVNTPTRWLTNSGFIVRNLRILGKLTCPLCAKRLRIAMSQQLQSDLCVAGAKEQPQRRPPLPKLDILAVEPDEGLQEEWEAEDGVKDGPLDPHEVKNAREKEIKYVWDMEVYEFSTEAEARARTGRNPVGLKVNRFQQRKCRSSTLPFASGVYGGAPQIRRADLLCNPSTGNPTSPALCCVPGRRASS